MKKRQTIVSFALKVSLEDAPVQKKACDGFGSVGELDKFRKQVRFYKVSKKQVGRVADRD